MLIHPLATSVGKPQRFNNPFDYEPHPLCRQAADEVLRYVAGEPQLLADALRGKMFGVLVVEGASALSGDSGLSYIAAYSGLLAGRNDWPFFVPPVFDAQQPDGHFKQTERHITAINAQLVQLTQSTGPQPTLPSSQSAEEQSAVLSLKQQRKQLSEELQLWLFRHYRMLNARGEEKDLVDIWRDYHSSPKIQQRFPLPPGGSGDCCAPKLLQYAYQHGLRPVAIAEFWYGESPKGEIRHHGQYYPACRGKCLPILTHMLQGLEVDEGSTAAADASYWRELMQVLYVDDALLVISKPSGLLSVPGRSDTPSVERLLAEQYGTVFMPHRLDMDTSGLMVVARNEETYKHLQHQFHARTIYKRYEALLDGPWPSALPKKGTISLSLRPDPLDRPRQVVDPLHGKQAITDYELIPENSGSQFRCGHPCALVSLIPHTGRTHQLRVHCAHHDGLGVPILGDPLYGQKGMRLCLHAAELAFDHPETGERMHFEASPDFGKTF
jgi:tRNA pseudouridine32 synthase/23S rRNA pseudouridine746 synthase